MPDKPTPLRKALSEAFLAYAKGMQEILERVARREDHLPKSLQTDTLAAADRVADLIEQIPAKLKTKDAEHGQ